MNFYETILVFKKLGNSLPKNTVDLCCELMLWPLLKDVMSV